MLIFPFFLKHAPFLSEIASSVAKYATSDLQEFLL